MTVNFALFVYFYYTMYSQVQSIAGWSKYEMMFFRGFSEMFFTIFLMLTVNSLQSLPRKIVTGELDFLLLKPVDSQFSISLSEPNLGFGLNLLTGAIVAGYSWVHMEATVDWWRLGLALIYTLLGLGLLYSMCMVIVTIAIWAKRAQFVSQVFFSLFGFLFVPASFFGGVPRAIFSYMLPVLFVFTVPVSWLLDKATWGMAFTAAVLSLGWFWISRVFWKRSVQFYTSSGS